MSGSLRSLEPLESSRDGGPWPVTWYRYSLNQMELTSGMAGPMCCRESQTCTHTLSVKEWSLCIHMYTSSDIFSFLPSFHFLHKHTLKMKTDKGDSIRLLVCEQDYQNPRSRNFFLYSLTMQDFWTFPLISHRIMHGSCTCWSRLN